LVQANQVHQGAFENERATLRYVVARWRSPPSKVKAPGRMGVTSVPSVIEVGARVFTQELSGAFGWPAAAPAAETKKATQWIFLA
jgi:hypothetical protein